MFRMVGALHPSRGGVFSSAALDRFWAPKGDNYGQEWKPDDGDIETGGKTEASSSLPNHQLIFFGEIHSRPEIIAVQTQLLQQMIRDSQKNKSNHEVITTKPTTTKNTEANKENQPTRVHLVMEHFSFDMQGWLDAYQAGEITFDQLVERYQKHGTEGHDLEPYQPLLETSRKATNTVALHAGFVPRPCARQLIREGLAAVLETAASQCWLPADLTDLQGSDFHYNLFESLITGRSLVVLASSGWTLSQPTERFRKIFRAQILKDEAMAHKINTLIQQHPNDRFLVVAGNGHVSHYQGVPERVLQHQSADWIPRTCVILSRLWNNQSSSSSPPTGGSPLESATVDEIVDVSDACDYVLAAVPKDDDGDKSIQQEMADAYNPVGATADQPGNLPRARAILQYLGYSAAEIDVAGTDAYNYQGVGYPHGHARIARGDTVLDVGSGLGVDSWIAAARTGPTGVVVGVDVAASQVDHANRRAEARGLATNVAFVQADLENLPLPDHCVDVVISNGAFCLAPDKKQAFAEVYRVLKPGGRMAICTTTQKAALPAGQEWPVCMQLFMAQQDVRPLCEQVGFERVLVDDRHSAMVYEIPNVSDDFDNLNPDRNRVHSDTTNEAYRHLEGYNMDELCARVCIVGYKPEEDKQ